MTIQEAKDMLADLIYDCGTRGYVIDEEDGRIVVFIEKDNSRIVKSLLDKDGKFEGFEVRIEKSGPIVPH